MSAPVDLNGDVGEGVGNEGALLPCLTSANIACGGHAGDDRTMVHTMTLARDLGVTVGAHPGFADRANFGRRELTLPAAEITALVTTQLAALGRHGAFHYVKPHGALYNLAAREESVAAAVVAGIVAYRPDLWVLGLAGSVLLEVAAAAGLRGASEVFADRAYDRQGRLLPRGAPGAVLDDPTAVIAQVRSMVLDGRVRATTGEWVPVRADSICLHGDGPQAVAFARQLRAELAAAGVNLRSFVA